MKNKQWTVGVWGNGFVGSAVAAAFSPNSCGNATVLVYDKDPLRSPNTPEQLTSQCDVIFVCVPTPCSLDGSIDLHCVVSALEHLSASNYQGVVAVKSTVIPGTLYHASRQLIRPLRLVFNPEFLTQRTNKSDFLTQTRIVLGGDPSDTEVVEALYRSRFGGIHFIHTTAYVAEFSKYFLNTFFATKISFANEMKSAFYRGAPNDQPYFKGDPCTTSDALPLDVAWNQLMDIIVTDGRIANSHLQVPGPDGKLGYGGACFPKDVAAMLAYGREHGIELNVLQGAQKTNDRVRVPA